MELDITWKSPSNLAIVKYWGKKDRQIPENASISLTLDRAHTITRLRTDSKIANAEEIDLDFYFEGLPNINFRNKLVRFLTSVSEELPFLKDYHFKIESINTFPHSSGIASSASSMSALALCLIEAEYVFSNKAQQIGDSNFFKRASYYARLFSGSACRSVFPYLSVWGHHHEIEGSADEYGIPYHAEVHDIFKSYHDDILIASRDEKSVSSTAGHQLMEGNIFAKARYELANKRLGDLLPVLASGDVDAFGLIAENEALTLHALMMCSEPSYILMKDSTLKMIELIKNYRQETKLPLYFSLDAGPNLHLLYPDEITSQVSPFINNELQKYCVDGLILHDRVGTGPQRMEN